MLLRLIMSLVAGRNKKENFKISLEVSYQVDEFEK